MLSSGSTEIWFQPELRDLYILHQEMVIFGIFLKQNFKYPPTTSGSSPKCDILEVWVVHVCTQQWWKETMDEANDGQLFKNMIWAIFLNNIF